MKNKIRIKVGEKMDLSIWEELYIEDCIKWLNELKKEGATIVEFDGDVGESLFTAQGIIEREETDEEVLAREKESRRLRVQAQIHQEKVERQMLEELKKKYEPSKSTL